MTPNTAKIILVRHGESEGNRDRRFTQSGDVALTDFGREQAKATGLRLRQGHHPSRIIASPYRRAHDTALIIAACFDMPVELDDGFVEQSYGIFAGRPYESLIEDAAFHEGPRWQWRPPEGESLIDVSERAVPALHRVAAASLGQEAVVVSHGGVMLALCAHALGSWDGLTVTPNAGVVIVDYDGTRFSAPRSE